MPSLKVFVAGGTPNALTTTMNSVGIKLESGASINIYPAEGESGEDILRRVERAAQNHQARGGGGVQLGRPLAP